MKIADLIDYGVNIKFPISLASPNEIRDIADKINKKKLSISIIVTKRELISKADLIRDISNKLGNLLTIEVLN